jgi:hypothetical protein
MSQALSCAVPLLAAAAASLASRVPILGRRGVHFAGVRHAAGFAFAGRLLEVGLAAILCFGLAATASLVTSDWAQNRHAGSELSRAAGILSFVIVLGVLGLALARFL